MAMTNPASPADNHALAQRTMRLSVALSDFERMYNEHFRSFSYSPQTYKPLTFKKLIDQMSWNKAIDAFMRASQSEPANLSYKHDLALALEHIGQIDHAMSEREEIAEIAPNWFANNIAIGRLSEFSKPINTVRTYYAQICTSPSSYCLALARSVALHGPAILDGMSIAELRSKIDNVTGDASDDLLLHLATGFIGLAKGDEEGARYSFRLACVVAKRLEPDIDDYDYDEWSLAYARAYLVDMLPPGRTAVPIFVDVNPAKLARACASAQGSVAPRIPLPRAYETALADLLPTFVPHNFQRHDRHRIAVHNNVYYAVPDSVPAFSFFRGKAVHVSPTFQRTVPRLRQNISSKFSLTLRSRIKRFLRRAYNLAFAISLKIPGARPVGRSLRELAINIYLLRYEVRGVIVSKDMQDLQAHLHRKATPSDRN